MSKRDEIAGQGLVVLDAAHLPDTFRVTDGVRDRGGRVLHRYGKRILIGALPTAAARGVTRTKGVVRYHAGAVDARPRGLTQTEALGVAAWDLRQSRPFETAKKERPHDGLRWDATGVAAGPQPPDGPGMEHVSEPGPRRAIFGDDTSLYLVGSVGIGLLLVEGPTPDLQFTEAERTKVVAECQEGLGWLALQDPRANVSFAYDIRVIRVAATPDPSLSGYEALESRWRDPAMASLGYAPNFLGVVNYVTTLRRDLGTRWAYAAFFTKYPLHHFAYALRPRLVMHYDNDGWGPDNIDRVFTHESGHIFGCPDEYASSNCTCDAKFGYLREPNANCQRCAAPFADCLMAANTWAMCAHTPVHLGWRDTDADGALDPDDPVGNPGAFVDLGRLCSSFPFVCQFLGLSPAPGAEARGIAGLPQAAPRPESVPVALLRRVLTDTDMERVEAAVAAEEGEYLAALERKLRAAADEIKRRGVSS
ncbi:MAG TPA: hypothetical protein VGA16_01645 [Candidatus Limnocylindria bacterium]